MRKPFHWRWKNVGFFCQSSASVIFGAEILFVLVDVQKSFYLLWLKAVGRLSSEAELKLFSKSNLLQGNEKNISV